jgi:hypothetical protein
LTTAKQRAQNTISPSQKGSEMKVTLSREECIKVLESHALTVLLSGSEKFTASMSTGNYSFPHSVEIDIVPIEDKSGVAE